MNNIDILNRTEYNFLTNNNKINQIIYMVLSGSHGYGTSNDNSDIDLRGVFLEQKEFIFGLEEYDYMEELETDTVLFSLKKFVSLCINANPNALELLGVEEDDIILMNNFGKMLRDNTNLFLTKKVISSFGNYANAQLRRLANALCHDFYNEIEQEKHLSKLFISQLEHFNRVYSSFDDNAIKIYLDNENLLFDINLTAYPLRDFVNIYSEMQNTIKTYKKINNRNRKKDDAHLYKHAMHLIRLIITGLDILNGKGIITKRKEEHNFLMDIRNGKYTFDEIFSLADEYFKKFEAAAKETTLPDEVDSKKISDLVINIYESSI